MVRRPLAIVDGIDVIGVKTLKEVVDYLNGAINLIPNIIATINNTINNMYTIIGNTSNIINPPYHHTLNQLG